MTEPSHVNIVCDQCGHRNRIERVILVPQTINIVCHGCESPQRAELTEQHIASQRAVAGAKR